MIFLYALLLTALVFNGHASSVNKLLLSDITKLSFETEKFTVNRRHVPVVQVNLILINFGDLDTI